MKLQASPVKQCALEHGIAVAQPRSLRLDGKYPDDAAAAREALLAAQADVEDDVERMVRNGQLDQASQLSSQHLQKSPQDPQMRLLSSRILEARGRTDEAMATLESLTRDYPELPEPHNNLAVQYARLGRTAEAVVSLQRAIQARPDYAVALENLGDLYVGMALQAYEQARQASSSSVAAGRKADTLLPLLRR